MYMLRLSSLSAWYVHDDSYSRNASCSLILISTFLLNNLMGLNDYDSNVIMVNRQIGRLTLKINHSLTVTIMLT